MSQMFTKKELQDLQDILDWASFQTKTDGLYIRIKVMKALLTKKLEEYDDEQKNETTTE